jgi:hypothetical protein
MRRTLALALTLSFSLLGGLATTAHAQESTTRGFNLGLHATGASLVVEDGDRNNAGGGGIWVGYGFNRTVLLFFQADGAQFDVENAEVNGDWTLAHADLGVRFHFANSLRSWVPYLQAAATGRAVSVTDGEINNVAQAEEISLVGGGITLGGGIIFYFNETLGLDLQLAWTGGRFTDIEVGSVTVSDLEIDAQSTRFNIGISWWP